MKKSFRNIVLVFSICVTGASAAEVRELPFSEIPAQHTAAISLSALFYCGLERWPASIHELQEFQKINQIPIGVEPNWDWLSGEQAVFTAGEGMTLVSTSSHEEEGEVVVSSGQAEPSCKKGETELNGAFVNIE